MTIKMSEIKFKDFNSVEEAVNYCLDNNIETLLNDYYPKPWVEYSLSDLYEVWDNFDLKNKL